MATENDTTGQSTIEGEEINSEEIELEEDGEETGEETPPAGASETVTKEEVKSWLQETLSPVIEAVTTLSQKQSETTEELKRLKRKQSSTPAPSQSSSPTPQSTPQTPTEASSETKTEVPAKSEEGKPVEQMLAKARREITRL